MKHLALFLMTLAFVLTSCSSQQNVSYIEGHNFYANPDMPTSHLLKITSRTDFEKNFGYAPVMGKNGEPTPIDFSKQFVIAKALPETDYATTITPVSLKKTKAGTLQFRYDVKRESQPRTYTIRPFLLIIVSNAYQSLPLEE